MLYNITTLHKLLISITICTLVGYGFFNSRFLIRGPEIVLANVDSETNIIHTKTKDFTLQGTIQHSSYITINNRPIMVDERGNFNEKLLLSSGVSIIDIYARDKFGKEVREKIDVVYEGASSSPVVAYEQIALRAQKNISSTTEESLNETGSSVSIMTATTTEEIPVADPDPSTSSGI